MGLSVDLIHEFAKLTNDTNRNTATNNALYGTIVEYNNSKWVKIDGSDLLTPISTVTNVSDGDRVIVGIQNHTATVNGNLTSPSATNKNVQELDQVIAEKVSAQELEAQFANINVLLADYAKISYVEAEYAKIETLDAEYVKTSELEAERAEIDALISNYATIANLEAVNARIDNITSSGIDTEYLDANFANINLSNITKAAMENFYSKSGLIDDVTINNGVITGELTGVTISGDLIKANTVLADKLVVKGADGLYYKLNTDGVKVEAEQTDYNSVNGSVIKAKSITATKISVSDLVAFGATIGGFNLTSSSIYSGVKESVNVTTRGVYMDKDGQMAIGDGANYIKYYKDTDNSYKLKVSANEIFFSGTGKSVEEMAKTATNYLKFDSSGLVIADMTAASLGKNVLITNVGVDIRNNATVLASFKANQIDLGLNSASSKVSFCGGVGTITASSINNNSVFDTLNVNATNIINNGERVRLNLTNTLGFDNRIEIYKANNTSGDYVGDYTGARLYSKATTSNSYSLVETTAYASSDDANVIIRAASDKSGKTSAIDVHPTYINLATDAIKINNIDITRVHPSFTPRGTAIAADSDLNTLDFIKIGNYYCASNATVATLKNSPSTSGFMMQVYAPLHTGYDDEEKYTYRYRIRKLMNYYGDEYVQYVYSGATIGTFNYGAWKKVLKSSDSISIASLTTSGVATLNNTVNINAGTHYYGHTYLEQSGASENTCRIYGALSTGEYRELLRLGGTSTAPLAILGDGLYNTGVGVTHVAGGTGVNILTKNNRLMFYDTTGDGYTAQFRPNNKGQITLGAAAYTWYAVYAANATIQTSDRRVKENILPIEDKHSELFDKLQPVQYNFIEGNGRTCYGLIAQDVISAMEELGIGENELDLVHHEYHTNDETGEEFDTYGIAYDNLISLLILEVQKLKSEMRTLKGEIKHD